MTISLPMTKAQFNEAKQLSFRNAVAATAGVELADVSILSMDEMARRAASLHVTTQVSAADASAGESIVSSWTLATLNSNLLDQGLEQATIITPPQVKAAPTNDSPAATPMPAAIPSSSSYVDKAYTVMGVLLPAAVTLCQL